MPKIKETLFGTDSGGGGANIRTEDDNKNKDVVPGVSPSQEVGTLFLDRMNAIREGFATEREIIDEEYARDRAALEAHLTGKDEIDAYYKDLMQQRAEQYGKPGCRAQESS